MVTTEAWCVLALVASVLTGCDAQTRGTLESSRSAAPSSSPASSTDEASPITIEARPGTVEPAHLALLEDFVSFALTPGPKTLRPLPLSTAGVQLGLGEDVLRTLDPRAAADASSWRLDTGLQSFRGRTGPFSALSTLKGHVDGAGQDPGLRLSGDLQASVGEHPHCASRPRPAPTGLETLERISLQPARGSVSSCIGWFTVDLFLDDGGDVVAVTTDLWEP